MPTLRYAGSVLVSPSSWLSLLLSVAALCSGAASLTLEVVWSKALVVPLGNSSDATAIVLSGFMLGIAAGAYLGAKLAQRTVRPLVAYASLELLLAALAVSVPRLFRAVTGFTAPFGVTLPPGAAFSLRLVACLCLIAVPCLVMGATLPLLLATSSGKSTPRRFVGALYGANTFGATLAAVVAGFHGVANWGISGSSKRAALASVAAALFAVLMDRVEPRLVRATSLDHNSKSAADVAVNPRDGGVLASATGHTGRPHLLALLATFVSGFALLAAEVFWARILTFVFGHDTYAFATLLAVVLFGLASGGMIYVAVSRRDPRRVAGWAMALTALSFLVSFYAASWLLIRRGRDPFALGDTFLGTSALSAEMLREFAYTPILVLLPCVFSGIAYPATIALCAGSHGSVSRATGSIGLTNGIGATLGAATTALGLVTWFGIQGVLSLVSIASAFVGSWLLHGSAKQRLTRSLQTLPLALTLGCVLVVPRDLPRQMLLSVVGPRHQTLQYYEEARTATVSVIRNTIHGERQLLVNAVNEVTTRLVHDQSFKLLGQLGPLLHPNPKRAVMICLGAGLAAGSALTHPLDRLDVVDLLQAVRRGAAHFAEENNHVLDDPRLVLHVNDGRQYLLTTTDRYDLAIVDSTHPKSVDSWILYTEEFFRLLRSRLNPDGIVVQWLPLHGLGEREFMSVVATFAAVFPQMTLWASVGYETYGHVGYAKLVGQRSDAPMRFDGLRMQARLTRPEVQHDLERYGMGTLPEILDQFVAGPARIQSFTSGSPRLSDDRPFLAYLTGLSGGRPMTPDRLLAIREPVLPYLSDANALDRELLSQLERIHDAQGFVVSGRLEQALAFYPTGQKIRLYAEQTKTTLPYYSALSERYADDPERLFEAGTQLGLLGHPETARTVLEAGLRLRPNSIRMRLNLGLLGLSTGDAQSAAGTFGELLRQHGKQAILHYNLGAAFLAQGEAGAARHALTTAVALDPESQGAQLALADAEIAIQDLPHAQRLLEDLLRKAPWHDAAAARLAHVTEKLGNHERAIELFSRAAQLDPYSEDYAVEYAKRLIAQRPAEAMDVLARAERLHPNALAPKLGLGETFSRLGQWQNASHQFELALELDPNDKAATFGLARALVRLDRKSEAKDALCLAARLGISTAMLRSELAATGGKIEDCATGSTAR